MAEWKAQSYGTVQYDMRPDVDLQGTIPDPSDEILREYFEDIKKFGESHGLNDVPTEYELRNNPERVQQMIDRMNSTDKIKVNHELTAIVAKLCQHKPSEEDILKLPYRKRVVFLRWIQDQLTSPEV